MQHGAFHSTRIGGIGRIEHFLVHIDTVIHTLEGQRDLIMAIPVRIAQEGQFSGEFGSLRAILIIRRHDPRRIPMDGIKAIHHVIRKLYAPHRIAGWIFDIPLNVVRNAYPGRRIAGDKTT